MTSFLAYIGGLYYKTLRIRNLRENVKFWSKLASYGLEKHTSLLRIHNVVIVQAQGVANLYLYIGPIYIDILSLCPSL